MVVGELLVDVLDAKALERAVQPPCAVVQRELIAIAAIDVDAFQPPQVVGVCVGRQRGIPGQPGLPALLDELAGGG